MIKCLQCSYENPTINNYCQKCGARIIEVETNSKVILSHLSHQGEKTINPDSRIQLNAHGYLSLYFGLFFHRFLAVFLHPRKTILILLTLSLNYGVFPILAIGSFLEIFTPDKNHFCYLINHGLTFSFLSIPCFAVLKYFYYWAVGIFLFLASKLFGGTANVKELFKYVIWTSPPDLLGKLFYVIAGICYSAGSNSAGWANASNLNPSQIVYCLFRTLASGLAVWSMIISVIMLSEIQKFSIKKSITISRNFYFFYYRHICPHGTSSY
jgi:hypothetical protein